MPFGHTTDGTVRLVMQETVRSSCRHIDSLRVYLDYCLKFSHFVLQKTVIVLKLFLKIGMINKC